MPDVSPSIGTQRDLTVRLGGTLRPQVLTLRLKSGQLVVGGVVRASLFQAAHDINPIASPTFAITALSPSTAGEPRYRIGLSRASVAALVPLATDAAARGAKIGMRTLYWSCAYEDAGGDVWPIYYGRLLIYLGATGA